MTPFVEAPLKGVAVKNDDECLFENEDSYSEWGLLTPPWSPCDSSAMDACSDCDLAATAAESAATVSAVTTRPRCDSFLCSCTSCECSGLEQVDGPVLRDCMWSQTTGLLPPPSLIARQTSDPLPEGAQSPKSDCRPCCPAISGACTNHTDRCVDPRNVFPCHAAGAAPKSVCALSQTVLQPLITADCSDTSSPVYDPDSETSAYCSSFSGLLKALTITTFGFRSTGLFLTSLPVTPGPPKEPYGFSCDILSGLMLALPVTSPTVSALKGGLCRDVFCNLAFVIVF